MEELHHPEQADSHRQRGPDPPPIGPSPDDPEKQGDAQESLEWRQELDDLRVYDIVLRLSHELGDRLSQNSS